MWDGAEALPEQYGPNDKDVKRTESKQTNLRRKAAGEADVCCANSSADMHS
ncbi:MAG: hypothetical protein Q9M92_10930 [Enterobacterales bacterium]|nr:hypothetical protein [Enterobacterales bacterium]